MTIATDEHVSLQGISGAQALQILGAAEEKFQGQELPFTGTLGSITYTNATLRICGRGATLVTEGGAAHSYDFNANGNYREGRWSPSAAQAVDLLKWIDGRLE